MSIPTYFVCPSCGGRKTFQGKLCRRCRYGNLEERLKKYIAVGKPKECWPWIGALNGTAKNYNNYGRLNLSGGRRILAHRLMYEIAFGAIPEGMVVCHRCDNPPCCNPSHLFIGTSSDNSKDAYDKGRIKLHGEHNPFRKLTAEAVRDILNSSASFVELGKRYNVHPDTIGRVKHRKTWRHIAP